MTGRTGLPDVSRDEGPNGPGPSAHCKLCRRPLDVAGVPESLDCGGDCRGCIDKIEREAGFDPSEYEDIEAIVDDYFAFQAAACTDSPDCTCGREHPSAELREAARHDDSIAEDLGLLDSNADLAGFVIPNVGTVSGSPRWSDGMYVGIRCPDGSVTVRLAAQVRRLKQDATSPTLSGERGGTE